jgi:hypothetical protein
MNLLESAFSIITDKEDVIKNYHPDYKTNPGNLFYILNDPNGRYKKGMYYVVENNGEFVCSAGWNEYDSDTALVLTRMYVAPKYRVNYYVANYILPEILKEVTNYKHVWATVNEYNKALYEWFVRDRSGKRTALFNDWPDIYRKFKPIGKKNIYYTDQYVIELDRNIND